MNKKFISYNSYYEGLLQDLFCGNDGLFSLFLHFFYQYNNIFVFNNNFSNKFQTLYKLELESCEKVCQLIFYMGGDAKYYSSTKKYISGMNIDYMKNLKSTLELDIELVEKSTIDIKNTMAKIENKEIKKQLNEILKIKTVEEKILKDIYLQLIELK